MTTQLSTVPGAVAPQPFQHFHAYLDHLPTSPVAMLREVEAMARVLSLALEHLPDGAGIGDRWYFATYSETMRRLTEEAGAGFQEHLSELPPPTA